LPDFSWYNKPKRKKYTKMGEVCIPNGHKMYQMAGGATKWAYNTPTSSIAKPSKIYSNWDFGFENIPSGNPAACHG
jgi:hypothetical protein